MKEQLQYLSLNVNGLGNKDKRQKIFRWLKNLHLNIILLQDTRMNDEDKLEWQEQWHLPGIWKKYTAVLGGSEDIKIVEVGEIDNSRVCSGLVTKGDVFQCNVASVYVPAKWDERSAFLEMLRVALPEDLEILAGDINMVGSGEHDWRPQREWTPSGQWHKWMELMYDRGLVDIHRRHAPDGPDEMTKWTIVTGGMVGSRIDQVYASEEWVELMPDHNTLHCPYSDHEGVRGCIRQPQNREMESGYWRLNTALLKREEAVQRFCEQWEVHPAKGVEPTEEWRQFKSWAQAFFVEEGEYVRRSQRRHFKCLEQRLQELSVRISGGGQIDASDIAERQMLVEELRVQEDEYIEGLRVRAHVRWVEEGERSTQYFARLISAKRTRKSMTGVLLENGETVATETSAMVARARQFYTHLYRAGEMDTEAAETLLDGVDARVEMEAQAQVGWVITEEEVLGTISKGKSNSAPGGDGLPWEFYKTFAQLVAPMLAKLLTLVIHGEGMMPDSSRIAHISILYKNKGREEDLKNW